MQFGADGFIWDFINMWVVQERAYPQYMQISPDGARVQTYDSSVTSPVQGGVYNTSASFSTSEGSFLTCSLGALALNRSEANPAGGTDYSAYSYINQKQGVIAEVCSELAKTNPLNPSGTNVNPIPFWKTQAGLLKLSAGGVYTPFSSGVAFDDSLETVEWSMDVTQNQVLVYTCNGSRLPSAVMMGPMDVSGTVVEFGQEGVFDPVLGPDGTGTLTSPALYADNTLFKVKINYDGVKSTYMVMPACVIEGDDYGIQGQDSVTNRTFNLKGMGGRCSDDVGTLPPFIMSDYDGSYSADTSLT